MRVREIGAVGGMDGSVVGTPTSEHKWLYPLYALVRRPGSRASEIGRGRQVGAKLRRLRAEGLVEPDGPAPARWYPTAAGRRIVNRQLLATLRERANAARQQTLAAITRAEGLYAFGDSLTEPAALLLCAPPRHRTLSFRELVNTLMDSVGRDVLISTDAGRHRPKVSPITAVGVIDGIEEERSLAIEDWLITLSIGDTAFIEFSRRHFESAEEDNVLGELYVRQGQTTVIWFESARSCKARPGAHAKGSGV
jgi:hypothetical protein